MRARSSSRQFAAFRFGNRARGRKKPGEMNKTEASYAQHLELLKRAGEIEEYWYERLTLKLADDLRYTADFMVLRKDGLIELHDTKGTKRNKATGKQTFYAEEDAVVKMKTVAEHFPFRVLAVWKTAEGWATKDFSKWEEAA